MGLEGKVAIVTGAGQGIGKAVALRLARDGADVVVADINGDTIRATAEEIRSLGRKSLPVQVNLTRVDEIQAMVDAAVKEFGHVDLLANIAGVVKIQPIVDVTEKDWDFVYNINTKGLFFALQAVAKQMLKQGSGGAIVNMSSASGRGPRPLQVHYASSKAAVISITQSSASAFGKDGIRVNAICPGIVETPMWDQIDEDMERQFGIPKGDFRKQRLGAIPLGRLETADDVARAVSFLVSEEANYITGQSLNVDGGFEMN